MIGASCITIGSYSTIQVIFHVIIFGYHARLNVCHAWRVLHHMRRPFHYRHRPLSNAEGGVKIRSSVFTKRNAFVARVEIKGERATLIEKATKLAAGFQIKDNRKIIVCNHNKEFC